MDSRNLLLVVVLTISYTYTSMSTNLIGPILGDLTRVFPQAGTKISMLVTLPALFMIVASGSMGYLSKYISKKNLLLIATAFYVVGGVGGGLIDNIDFMLFTRALVGIGAGLSLPLIPALIAELYDQDDVPKILGWANAGGSIWGVILTIIVGYMAVVDWHYAFYLYGVYGVILIAQLLVLPKKPLETKAQGLTKGEKPRLNWLAYVYTFASFVVMMVSMVYIVKASIFITEANLGNSAQAGIASSLVSVASIVFSLIFGTIYRIFNRYTFVLGMGALGICYYLLSIAQSILMVNVASLFLGVSFAVTLAYLIAMVSKVVPKGAQAMAIAYVSTAMPVGRFGSAYFIEALEFLAGGGTQAVFQLAAYSVFLICAVAVFFIVLTKDKVERLIGECAPKP